MSETVLDRVRRVACEELSVSPEEVQEHSSLSELLDLDSLDVVELFMALEAEFQIEIPDEDISNLYTVADIVAYIEKTL
jgi:acyl carrier protein